MKNVLLSMIILAGLGAAWYLAYHRVTTAGEPLPEPHPTHPVSTIWAMGQAEWSMAQLRAQTHRCREQREFPSPTGNRQTGVVFIRNQTDQRDIPPWEREHRVWLYWGSTAMDSVLRFGRAMVKDTTYPSGTLLNATITQRHADSVTVRGTIDLPLAGLAAFSFVEAHADSLYALGAELPVLQQVEFGLDPTQAEPWRFAQYAWEAATERVLVRFTSAKLDNSEIEHRGHRDRGDFLVAWVAVDAKQYHITDIYLSKEELIWLE
ncbi:MAG: hypothetical protein D6675_03380 [Gemmatimonadetes bacterium]|nr:MAG: hypothetical protein D6675_03380 [Gemmatimonadota bacterium]